MTVVAWVLVFGLYYNNGFAISGIASEAACNELRQKIAAEYLYTPVPAVKSTPTRRRKFSRFSKLLSLHSLPFQVVIRNRAIEI